MRRAPQLIPFSRFHKRVLFIGESCKTDGARFSGYPTDLDGRVNLLKDFVPLLKQHLDTLQQAFDIFESSTYNLEISEQHSAIKQCLQTALDESSSEETLNAFGREVVKHVRYLERTVFQNLQEASRQEELDQVFRLAEEAGIYELHQL